MSREHSLHREGAVWAAQLCGLSWEAGSPYFCPGPKNSIERHIAPSCSETLSLEMCGMMLGRQLMPRTAVSGVPLASPSCTNVWAYSLNLAVIPETFNA